MIEDTLVILKPDALSRGLVGIIIGRLENVGLKMVACKMVRADKAVIKKMYNIDNDEWVNMLGEKTLSTYKEYGLSAKELLGTDDTHKLGLEIARTLREYMEEGPVIAMVWEGVKAVTVVRKLRGSTTPLTAEIGSLLGDYSHDSQISAPFKGRSLRNLAHASGSVEEANEEIELWFGKNFKPAEYDRTDALYF